MKRFTETDKWKDPWFRNLAPTEKLVFIYVIENCNNAGFYEVDFGQMAFNTGLSQSSIEGAIEGLARGLAGANGWLWARTFLKHQKNDRLNPENNAHKQIISLIKEQAERFKDCEAFNALLGAHEGLFSPLGKVKVKVSSGEEGMQGEKNQGKARCSMDEAVAFCQSEGLPVRDGEWFVNKCEGNGWTNNGKPIKDWKATIRAWKAANYMPSQKSGAKKPTEEILRGFTTAAAIPENDPFAKLHSEIEAMGQE